MGQTRDLVPPARRIPPPRPTPAPVADHAPQPDRAARSVAVARALAGLPVARQRGNTVQRTIAIQRLQQTLGNRTTRRLIQRQRAKNPPVPIQRQIHDKADRALTYAINHGAHQDYAQAKALLEQVNWISVSNQGELTHLRSQGSKNRNINDDALTHRLEMTRALLMTVYVRNVRAEVLMEGNNPTQKEKKAAEKRAYDQTLKMRDNLKGWGITKPGDQVRPELVKELNEGHAENQITPGMQVDVGPRIEVRGTVVPNGPLSKLKGVKFHTFIVYTDAQGDQRYIAAHSDPQRGTEQVPNPLIAKQAPYGPGVHEWDPNADSRILEDKEDGTAAKWDQMVAAINQVNAPLRQYKVLKRNCNTATSFILRTAGVNNYGPPGSQYVGWDKNL